MTAGHIQFAHDDDGFTFSQTGVNKYRLCPELARVVWSGEDAETFGVEALTGIAAHAGIDAMGRGLDWESAVAEVVHAEWESVVFPGGAEYLGAEQVILNACQAVPIGGQLAQVRVEHRMHSELFLSFDLPYGRHPKKLRGTLDEVQWGDAGGYSVHILDWKVSKSLKYIQAQKIAELRKEAVQPTIYIWLLSQMMGVDMEDILFVFIVIHPVTGRVYEVPVTRNEDDIVRLAVELDGICDLWQSDLPQWPLVAPGHWLCNQRWCHHWERCPGGSPQYRNTITPVSITPKGT